jgi:hypothetical protein
LPAFFSQKGQGISLSSGNGETNTPSTAALSMERIPSRKMSWKIIPITGQYKFITVLKLEFEIQ